MEIEPRVVLERPSRPSRQFLTLPRQCPDYPSSIEMMSSQTMPLTPILNQQQNKFMTIDQRKLSRSFVDLTSQEQLATSVVEDDVFEECAMAATPEIVPIRTTPHRKIGQIYTGQK